jgi:hypothetical protein
VTRTFGLTQSASEGAPPRAPSLRVRRHIAHPAEHARFLGDKRTQLVYDLDEWNDAEVIDEIVGENVGLQFGPDTLAEARNRGYTLARPGSLRLRRKPRA